MYVHYATAHWGIYSHFLYFYTKHENVFTRCLTNADIGLHVHTHTFYTVFSVKCKNLIVCTLRKCYSVKDR